MSRVGKQQKLTINAFSNVQRNEFIGDFQALFNPQSIKQSTSVRYSANQGINSSGQTQNYISTSAKQLSVKLLLDGTGPMYKELKSRSSTISNEVDHFMALTQQYNGAIHQPNFLCVNWGGLDFNCRLQSLETHYTLFNGEGQVLSAELDCTFIADEAAQVLAQQEHKQSPDMTHIRYIDASNNLCLIANDIYQSPTYYLALARFNQLINFRSLPYGQKIICPPLAELTSQTLAVTPIVSAQRPNRFIPVGSRI
jgi:nucleoid-associated protein YgaU